MSNENHFVRVRRRAGRTLTNLGCCETRVVTPAPSFHQPIAHIGNIDRAGILVHAVAHDVAAGTVPCGMLVAAEFSREFRTFSATREDVRERDLRFLRRSIIRSGTMPSPRASGSCV